jgi:hypothetical protein
MATNMFANQRNNRIPNKSVSINKGERHITIKTFFFQQRGNVFYNKYTLTNILRILYRMK